MNKPRFLDDEAFKSLREGNLKAYLAAIEGRETIDLSDSNLRGTDLRGFDLSRVIIRGAYFRDANLKGLDLSRHDLEGVTLLNARVSGASFPSEIPPEEIRLSIEHGTRIRHPKPRS